MMYQSLDAVPTIDKIFESDTFIRSAVKRHLRTNSPIPLVLLTELDALDTIRNIGPKRAKKMKQLMADDNLRFRSQYESARRTVDALFGSLDDAPIAVLQVMWSTADGVTITKLWPLTIICQLEELEPKMQVGDLLAMTESNVRGMLDDHLHLEADQLRARLHELQERLAIWKVALKRHYRLRAVG